MGMKPERTPPPPRKTGRTGRTRENQEEAGGGKKDRQKRREKESGVDQHPLMKFRDEKKKKKKKKKGCFRGWFQGCVHTLWKSYLLSCLTKLAKLLCLKCFGRRSLANSAWSLILNESPVSFQLTM